ncbi:FAD-dependent oxidoreductase [Peptoniphilus stercorisuis]|uniref:Rubredoxin n=1 Tax=Peptoniphilus stercorisuis TaxID=1436965 RepID=A0ABS4KFF5_9FIRM|nr:FAD-dependent oxidoreductase [Peptoniphilus stercorisuis]MBP2026115.1 rubredoxin [Peptoniphilus stercorisuis]
MKKWRCLICNYIHEGDSPPDICPVCGASSENFVLVEDDVEVSKNTKKLDDVFVDFLVVGSGAAGLSAAIVAKNDGLNVLVIEKGEVAGGTTARSGARYWIPNNRAQKRSGIEDNLDDAIKYMCRYSFPNDFNEDKEFFGIDELSFNLIKTYCNTGHKVVDLFADIGLMESEMQYSWKRLPQVDYMETISENKKYRGRTIMPKTEKGESVRGIDLVNFMTSWLLKNNVEIRLNTSAEEILQNDDKEVIGISVKSPDGIYNIYANKGVYFGSGGFSHNPELMRRFQNIPSYGGCAFTENTGDFVRMAESIGAKLSNMNNAYRTQALYEGYLNNPTGVNSVFYIVGDSTIQVNKYGKRVVNEKRNYNDRTLIHGTWDAVKGEFPNKFLFLIMDSRTASNWQGMPPIVGGSAEKMPFVICGSDVDDLTKNIEKRLNTLKDDTNNFELDSNFSKNLKETIKNFNSYYEDGVDKEFNRGASEYDNEFFTFPPLSPKGITWPPKDSKNLSIYPIEDGPLYAFILSAGTLDTNGGPMINERAQILDFNNEPVVGLYGGGNCIASPGKAAYWGAGATIGNGMVWGYIAAKDANK